MEDSPRDSGSPKVRPVVVPGPRETIDYFLDTAQGLLVTTHSNVRGRPSPLSFARDKWTRTEIPLPDFGSVDFLINAAPSPPEVVVNFQSFLQPPSLYRIDMIHARAQLLKSMAAQVAADRLVSEQFEARSKDGTRVPYFVTRPITLAYDGQAPTLVHAYGGNGIPSYPYYDETLGQLWLERGGIYVLANIRGGGEFGPAWHQAAVKTGRQRAFDDFIAVAQDLIRHKITSPRRLGASGFSNGGGLMA